MFKTCLYLAWAIIVFGIVLMFAPKPGRGARGITFLICLALADLVMVVPLAMQEAKDFWVGLTLIPYDVSLMVLFEGGMDAFRSFADEGGSALADEGILRAYIITLQLLYVATPFAAMLAAYMVITRRFQELRAHIMVWLYNLRPNSRIYLFDGLNKRSATFVRDVFRDNRKSGCRPTLCIFADTSRDDREQWSSDVEDFSNHAVYYTELGITELLDMLDRRPVPPAQPRKLDGLHAFFFGDDEGRNLSSAIRYLERLADAVPLAHCESPADKTSGRFKNGYPRYHAYCACSGESGELMLDSIQNTAGFDIRVINEAREIIYDLFFEHPLHKVLTCNRDQLFRATAQDAGGDEDSQDCETGSLRNYTSIQPCQPVNLFVYIVGCGHYGLEALRTAAWAGQITGVKLTIHVFDQQDPSTFFSKLRTRCPQLEESGLLNLEYHSARAGEHDFLEMVRSVRLPAGVRPYVIVTLGDDDLNTETAVALRRLFYGSDAIHDKGTAPIRELPSFDDTVAGGGNLAPSVIAADIHVDISDERRHATLENLKASDNKGGLPFAFDPFGGIGHLFCEHRIVDSELEALAFNVNASYEWALGDDAIQRAADARISAKRKSELIRKRQELFLSYSSWQMNRLSSITNAIGLRTKLWFLGYRLVPDAGDERAASELRAIAQSLAKSDAHDLSTDLGMLASAEHDRWMAFYYAEGWTSESPEESAMFNRLGLNNRRHDSHLLMKHPYLCPFQDLPEVASRLGKEDPTAYDVKFICEIPQIIFDEGGYTAKRHGVERHDQVEELLRDWGIVYRKTPNLSGFYAFYASSNDYSVTNPLENTTYQGEGYYLRGLRGEIWKVGSFDAIAQSYCLDKELVEEDESMMVGVNREEADLGKRYAQAYLPVTRDALRRTEPPHGNDVAQCLAVRTKPTNEKMPYVVAVRATEGLHYIEGDSGTPGKPYEFLVNNPAIPDHGAGDMIVCELRRMPEGIYRPMWKKRWVVNGAVFQATYESVPRKDVPMGAGRA